MKATFITREYPPHVYGGAGVHVRFLTRELSKLMQVEVRCFGEQRSHAPSLEVKGYQTWDRMWEGSESKFNSTLGTFSVDLSVVRDAIDADVVHTHTWYASLAGFLAKTLYDVPLVATVHSLEPLRPWKEEQLGRSYHLSTWAEKTALENADRIIAVSKHAREDILRHFAVVPERVRVIHNGIDLEIYKKAGGDQTRKAFGIRGDYVLFVGRVSRQKGMSHLIDAMRRVDPGITCVCCTSAPDTVELEEETKARVAAEPRVTWINSMLREDQYVELYSNALCFCCPSVYEPFGIINLEAMACETPVVASAVGGILETVKDGETGILVEPGQAEKIADGINTFARDRELGRRYGKNGRKRVEEHFSWTSIAAQTMALYAELKDERRKPAAPPPAKGQ
ncbi:MAG: glycogen synthase [Deltaproteobacteria bacterium]|nr:glycogen synthase [Deltaproteobacteria bacterium]